LGVGHLQKNKEHLLITFYNRLMSVGYIRNTSVWSTRPVISVVYGGIKHDIRSQTVKRSSLHTK